MQDNNNILIKVGTVFDGKWAILCFNAPQTHHICLNISIQAKGHMEIHYAC
jgi:hypothetical protein